MYKAVIIGASTGGPNALRTILKKVPEDFPLPILILQRIPQGLFAESLAEALDEVSPIKVRILNTEDHLKTNEAVLVPGGFNIKLLSDNEIKLVPSDDPENSPSISQTLEQFNGCSPVLFTVLTGISLEDELVNSIKAIKDKGGKTIVQSPETCFIDDLPQIVISSGLADEIIALEDISQELAKKC